MYVKPTAPRNIGGVLDDSIRLYREGFAKVWPLALAAQALLVVPTLLFRIKMLGSGVPNPQAALAMYMTFAFWLPYAAAFIASISFYNAITLQLSGVFNGQILPAGQSLRGGLRLMPRVISMFLFFFLCWAAAALLFYFAFKGSALIRAILSIVAFPLAVYLLGRVYLVNVALVADDLPVFKSVETSWALTRGNWWRGATIYTVIIVIVMVLYFVVGLCTGLVVAALGPKNIAGIGLTELFSLVGGTLLFPLITATMLGIYNDFKLRNEGTDLADRVNALASR